MLQTERVPTGILGTGFAHRRRFSSRPLDPHYRRTGHGKINFRPAVSCRGAEAQRKCIFVSADENPMDILEQAASMGWDFEPSYRK